MTTMAVVPTTAEIALGTALLPDGQRKQALQSAAEAMFAQDFSGDGKAPAGLVLWLSPVYGPGQGGT